MAKIIVFMSFTVLKMSSIGMNHPQKNVTKGSWSHLQDKRSRLFDRAKISMTAY